jgi:hypothetical protein
MEIKTIISIVAGILVLISYFFYIKSILKGKSRPHVFTWGLWAVIVFILFLLQRSSGAGFGALPTLVVAILCLVILILSLIKESNKNIRTVDIVFLIITILAIPIWVLAKAPMISTTLLIVVYSLAGEATIRKSWIDPYSEIITLWAINSLRALLSIFALSKFNFITLAFPVLVFLSATAFALMLIFRRNYLKFKK